MIYWPADRRGRRLIAKSEVRDWPVWPVHRLQRGVFIERQQAQDRHQVNEIAVGGGGEIVAFSEGTPRTAIILESSSLFARLPPPCRKHLTASSIIQPVTVAAGLGVPMGRGLVRRHGQETRAAAAPEITWLLGDDHVYLARPSIHAPTPTETGQRRCCRPHPSHASTGSLADLYPSPKISFSRCKRH